MSTFTRWALLLFLFPVVAFAQLQITYPMTRLVVQRGADGNGRLFVSGRLTSTVDRIEAQLTPVAAGQGTATGWQVIQTNPANNLFLGSLTGVGGWYMLTVRAVVGGTVTAQATVQPVGIGEVFITAGQSNARGINRNDNDLGTATDRVNAIDSINHYYDKNTDLLNSSGDPFPVPNYKALTAGRRVFPMAESSWGWGELGDYIVNRYNVPVAFYVTGWDGSTAENWSNTANGIPTCNRYFCNGNWPNLQPYTNLKNVLNYYGSMAGVRAVLWHQGEAEYSFADGNTSIPQYYDRLTNIIQKSRSDFGGRNVPWMVARASFDGAVTRTEVVNQQQRVIDTPGLNVFQGPYNDTIINRNAGNTDVHFANGIRPVTHPQYYLNPASIPARMGLSRFARNWNNSMTDGFFQNAQPITPSQFAATGTLANTIAPNSTIQVTFATLGTFNGDNQWQVQLLNQNGQYVANLGSGASSPIAVTLPSAYQSGRYQIRVVSTAPTLLGVPSNIFEINNVVQPQVADLSLAMGASQRTPEQNSQITLSLVVKNDGPGQATNVVVRNRLPDNLAFVSSSELSASGTVLTSAAFALNAGASRTFTFIAQPTAAGTYRNAAEIAQASSTDPDSQPDSGTGDGQDDMAALDFRTKQLGGGFYVSPNPNQVPLPAVQSNQPTPDADKADVSITLSASNRIPNVGEIITYTLTVKNAGGLTATGLSLGAYLPAGQTFVPGNDFSLVGTTLVGNVSNLAAQSSVTLRFRAQATASGQGVCTAQVLAAGQPDPDSTPGNGVDNGEDDTARADIRVK
ncbi:sialate O-acetylesterase [Spirosoma sp. KUDC1026]|uniref:sialate O-acetylesterase n=1 Tax=Spirosoma sp. KUDC1026 TaxID=2745947 RepID=UPI00159B8D3B|nr:sialate O-acetylesterase [Spirosoma sp. KUDC1026]QKZ11790.1 DUF11 domain-containing protein [Spirosoma sp. KUDC1026]